MHFLENWKWFPRMNFRCPVFHQFLWENEYKLKRAKNNFLQSQVVISAEDEITVENKS